MKADKVKLGAYGAPLGDIYANPLLHPKLSKFPKTYITCAGCDTLRDDARLMAEALKDAGVDVKYDEFPGYPHFFWVMPGEELAETRAHYHGKVFAGINWVLS